MNLFPDFESKAYVQCIHILYDIETCNTQASFFLSRPVESYFGWPVKVLIQVILR